MDCPTCGLNNPPEAHTCDCGYDFNSGKRSLPSWRINLAWRQQLAAFWAISWPALLASFVNTFLINAFIPFRNLMGDLRVLSITAGVSFFAVQAMLVPRLVRKNYRTFRIVVARENEQESGDLSVGEALRVWLWILSPQLALLLITYLATGWYGSRLPPETIRSISSLSLWLRFLAVGPYSISMALGAKYPGFRLVAHGFRYT